MPLTLLKAGETARIISVKGKEDLVKQLSNLGFVVGSLVTLVNENAGNFIINVKDSRIAISKEIAGRINVSVV